MKRLNWIGILALCLCWGVCLRGYSITSLSGTGSWAEGTLENNISVDLTANITLNGLITIPNGKTLTITAAANRTITNGKTELSGMFYVQSGGKLVIKGDADGKRVIIDGGSGSSRSLTEAAIRNVGTLEMEYATIQNVKRASGSGGGIYIFSNNKKNGTTKLTSCTIQNCTSGAGSALHITTQTGEGGNTPASCAVTLTNTVIQKCVATEEKGGGTIRTNGLAVAHLTLDKVQVLNNQSDYGAGLYWNAHGHKDTKCTIKGCTFKGNVAGVIGGAMMLESSFEFTESETLVEGNQSEGVGGGLAITGYSPEGTTGGTQNFNFSDNLKINKNRAGTNGGGISIGFGAKMGFEGETQINVRLQGAKITGNTAAGNGGGIFFNNENTKSNITISAFMDSGTLTENTATNGGGMYITNTAIQTSGNVTGTLTIQGNTATADGGGIYSTNGNVSLGRLAISGNTATRHGGGLCVTGGTFTMQNGSNISNNTATNGNGGGLYINSTSGTVKCSGGTFVGNHAKAGGGACIDGALTVALDATLEDNEATNGGGIYLANGATLNFGSGLIRRNRAESTTSLTTAYQGTATTVSGIGGGIFLADKTTLTFTNTGALGIYNNSASNGADDIFANGNGTKITLPNIETMSLREFDVPASKLYWVEDYVSGDTSYDQGTKLKTSGSVNRYQYALQQGLDTWTLGNEFISPNVLDKYACLTLSYELIYVTLKKIGLKKNDDAIFTISYQDKNKPSVAVPYRKLILTGTGSDVEKVVALPSGNWKFEESSVWGKKYNPISADWIEISKTNNTVTVTNTAIDDYDATIEAEHRVVNRLKP